MRVLVTGAAGFIGYHVAQALLDRGDDVLGADDLNPYYDPGLKQARLDRLAASPAFAFTRLDLADRTATAALFADARPDAVVHLAAQAGVRHSLDAPHAYVDANVSATLNVLEGCRAVAARHLVFASSSSVYGASAQLPSSERDPVDHPISLYAATKRAGELMAHSYAHLFALPVTGLRFFTVYGPWYRPDMALHLFTRAILAGQPIKVFNQGRMRRDFTFVDDAARAVLLALDAPPAPGGAPTSPDQSAAPFRLYNVGGGRPVALTDLIDLLETALGRPALRDLQPLQPGDVVDTEADITSLHHAFGFTPQVPLEQGLPKFVAWYRAYYGV